MSFKQNLNRFKKEVHLFPIILSLFLVPVFVNPQFIHSFVQGKEILFKSIILLTLFLSSIFLFFKKKVALNNISNSLIFFILLAQISIYSITTVLSDTPLVALHGTYSRGFGFIVDLLLFAFATYVGLLVTKSKIPSLLKYSFVSGLLVAVLAIFQKFGVDPFFSNYDTDVFVGRSFSSLGNPSYLGQFMLLTLIIGSYLTLNASSSLKKMLYLFGSLLMLTALIFSGTRTAVVALCFSLLLVFVRYRSFFMPFLKKYLAFVVLGLFLIPILLFTFQSERYSFSEVAFRSLNSRIEIWDGAVDLIKEKSFLGHGENTFYIYFPEIITKNFLQLEESINTNVDRIHNESLEILFAHGLFGFLVYLVLFLALMKVFFTTKSNLKALLSLVIIANFVQNQFAFPDITICILISFCLGSLIAIQSKKSKIQLSIRKWAAYLPVFFGLLLLGYLFITAVYNPYMSNSAYANSKRNYANYEIAIENQKKALYYTPYYSELWYDLIFIDPSSMERALFFLEKVDGDSGNVLAWKGNFYKKTDKEKSADFYIRALEKNPYHPNWIRAFADMLYFHKDYEHALFMYEKYLESIPDFWQWGDKLQDLSPQEQKSHRIFFKNTPYFYDVAKRIEELLSVLDNPV
jgi:O-antigen ligase